MPSHPPRPTGRHALEWVVAMRRNEWSPCPECASRDLLLVNLAAAGSTKLLDLGLQALTVSRYTRIAMDQICPSIVHMNYAQDNTLKLLAGKMCA